VTPRVALELLAGVALYRAGRRTTSAGPFGLRGPQRAPGHQPGGRTKHAPGATVQIHLTRHPCVVRVAVVNAAPTTRPPHKDQGGTGLHGLSERVTLLGGTFTAAPNADGGFTVEATLPTGRTKVDQKDSTYGGSARNPANA